MSQAPSPRSSSRFRRRTSPVCCTWGTRRRSPSRTRVCRERRMRGYEVEWAPGTDHAAIATAERHRAAARRGGYDQGGIGQGRVSDARRRLVRGIRRADHRTDAAHGIHVRLGALCASRSTTGTCTPSGLSSRRSSTRGSSIAVRESSTGARYCRSAISDEEIEWREQTDTLYYLKYPVEGGQSITVATVRPETMLGDTGVAVAPGDSRYASLIGKHVDAAAHLAGGAHHCR